MHRTLAGNPRDPRSPLFASPGEFALRTQLNSKRPCAELAARSKLRTAQKRLSRCEQGSKNREKARSRVAHICQRVPICARIFFRNGALH